MNSKSFMPVHIPPPHDQIDLAQRIPVKSSPFPEAALKLLVMPAMTSSPKPQAPEPAPVLPLSLSGAIRVKSAQYWLMLGEPDEALRELEQLPRMLWNHRVVLKVRVAAMGMLRDREQIVARE